MTKKTKRSLQKILSLLLCMALIAGYAPLTATAVGAESRAAIVGAVADPGTAESWENMMGTDADGNRYAGRVWVDKSVYVDDEGNITLQMKARQTIKLLRLPQGTAVTVTETDPGNHFEVSYRTVIIPAKLPTMTMG